VHIWGRNVMCMHVVSEHPLELHRLIAEGLADLGSTLCLRATRRSVSSAAEA
jgi:hypothetical protein